VPSAKNESMEFGSAMHEVLQKIYFHSSLNQGEILPVEKAKKEFAFYMSRHRESFTDIQFQRRIDYGNIILDKIYPKYINGSHKNVSLEQRFKNIHCEGIPINGIIDKLELYDNDVNVVDYKTGPFHKSKFSPPSEVESSKETHETLHGGDYWRQAVFYSLILENDKMSKYNFQSAEFIFIEPDNKTDEIIRQKIFVDKESKAIVIDQIKSTWAQIHNHEFERGCNEDNCDWCNFLKRTKRRERTTEMSLE
jgi:DNA helicase-2/ATP-dependent DNA helicase PcrA